MEFDTFHIIIDTNEFYRLNFNFNHHSINTLQRYIEQGYINLYSHEIIEKEVYKNIGKKTEETKGTLKRNINNLALLKSLNMNYINQFLSKVITEDIEDIIKNKYKQFLSNNCHKKIPTDFAVPTEIIQDYFNVNPPFDVNKKNKKSEFPDAFILNSINKYAKQNNIIMHIISNDSGFTNYSNNYTYLTVYNKLEIFLNKFTTKLDQAKHDNIEKIVQDNIESLFDILKNDIENAGFNFSCINDEVEVDYSAITVDDLYEEHISISDFNDESADILLELNIILSAEIEYKDYSEAIYDKEDGVYFNVENRKGRLSKEFTVDMDMKIQYEPDYRLIAKNIGQSTTFDIEFETYDLNDGDK
ncbi:MAG: PIN domain-containing protein [Leptospirales bacterium]